MSTARRRPRSNGAVAFGRHGRSKPLAVRSVTGFTDRRLEIEDKAFHTPVLCAPPRSTFFGWRYGAAFREKPSPFPGAGTVGGSRQRKRRPLFHAKRVVVI